MSTVSELPTDFLLNNGLRIPSVGLGTFQGDKGNGLVKEIVLAALKKGYRHIDTASGYGNEKEIGDALLESGIARAEIFVTTKL
jgi:diketogulonate reductase-like aldo/keto reductase